MAQQLKAEVQARMLAAAEEVFAEWGYERATMALIARRAGVATGNLYRYFENKDTLFYATFTDDFADELLTVLRRRVDLLVAAADLSQLPPDARAGADELLRFWIDHRLKVITLLAGAEGSRYADFPDRFVQALMRPTLEALRARAGGARLPAALRFTLQNVFDNTVRTIVCILRERRGEAAIREAFDVFWTYQLGGLAELQRKVSP